MAGVNQDITEIVCEVTGTETGEIFKRFLDTSSIVEAGVRLTRINLNIAKVVCEVTRTDTGEILVGISYASGVVEARI